MRDSNICPHADELPCAFKPSAATNNHVHASRWSSRIRAITDSYAYPLPPSNMSIRAPRRRRHYVYPRKDSGVYMPLSPNSDSPTSHYCPQAPSGSQASSSCGVYMPTGNTSSRPTSDPSPQAPSNPFEDPQYEYGTTMPERRPMREWRDVLEDQCSDPSASVVNWKFGKAYRGRLRSRVQALFTSANKATSEQQQQAGSTLSKGPGTHIERGTMRVLQCTDCQREMEARSLVR
jgi:hypothetical protein